MTVSPGHAGDLGYEFDLPKSAARPVHHRLTVWIRPVPTEHHFDPETLSCPAASGDTVIVRHPWTEGAGFRVRIGLLQLKDRKNKVVEAFSFGGALRIESQESETRCDFTSPAPLLPILEADSLQAQVTFEIEAVVGACRAQWNGRHPDSDFEAALARPEPLALYAACLETVEARLRAIHSSDEPLHAVLHYIDHERDALRDDGQWPEAGRKLMELLELN